MSKDVGAIYTEAWLRAHAHYRDEFRQLADIVEASFFFGSVIDVGCGASLALERLAELGHEVRGVDGSPHALTVAPDPVRAAISIVDLADVGPGQLAEGARFDLVMCTEVAEHLAPELADHLVALLVALARGPIYFTAATPGQGGTDHVNEQPPAYWIEKFRLAGCAYDVERTELLRERLKAIRQMTWYQRTSMVFRWT